MERQSSNDGCNREHCWPNIDKALWLEEHKHDLEFDNQSGNPGSCTVPMRPQDRGPLAFETVTGQVSQYNPFDSGAAAEGASGSVSSKKNHCIDVVIPNPSTRKSFEPWSGGPSKPCIRVKCRRGVMVGYHPAPDVKILDEESRPPWDSDTWIPKAGIFTKVEED